MWRDSLAAGSLTPGHLVLLEEACRIADRLETLDRLIRSTARRSGGDSEESGGIAGLLAESRQQQSVLKTVLAELRQGRIAGASSAAPTTAGGSGVADLTARIAKRRNPPQG